MVLERLEEGLRLGVIRLATAWGFGLPGPDTGVPAECVFLSLLFANLTQQLDNVGAIGLVLFHRFSHPDLDLDGMKVVPRHTLSQSSELLLRLHWVAVLQSHVLASLAITGGVATLPDGIKAILVGADAVQMTSAVLRNGPKYFNAMSEGLSCRAGRKRTASSRFGAGCPCTIACSARSLTAGGGTPRYANLQHPEFVTHLDGFGVLCNVRM